MKKKLLNFMALFMLFTSIAFAQERKISGRVISSDDNNGLPGVSVTIQGTNNMVQTDNKGNYAINVPTGTKALVFKSIGFETREISLSTSNTLNITLNISNTDLNEVEIVVPYGTVKKGSNVGSSAQINADQFDKKPVSNALNALVGIAPGVQTTVASGSPGSAPAIRVRGFGSISASTSALIVVDGVVFDGGISNINPDDIESISVLKDAATTVLYGSRGANGVIMITTKKGRKGQSNISFNVSNGIITRGLKEYDRVDAYQYYPLMWEVYRNTLQYGAQKIPKDIASSIASGLTTSYNGNNYSGISSILGYNPFNVAENQIVDINGKLNPNAGLLYADDLDWAKEIEKGGGKKRQNYSMNYDAGTEKSDFFASFGYTNEEGYIAKSGLKRFTGRVSANTQATKWFRTGLNISATQSEFLNDATGGGGSTIVNPFYSSRYIAPIYPVYLHDQTTGAYILDDKGNRIFDEGGGKRQFVGGRHPIWENQLNNSKTERSAFSARTYGTIKFLPYLTATTNLSFDVQDSHDRDYTNPIIGDAAPAGRSNHDFGRTRGYTWNQIVNFDKAFGNHTVNALAGHENYQVLTNSLSGARSEIIVDGVYELPNFATISSLSSSENIATVESYFSRVNYDFKQKYLLSASIRRDGNSKFFSDVRWANFWSVGAGYNIEKEDFFKIKWVDILKVRASYGSVGNAGGISNYAYQSLYTLGRNNAAEPGFSQSSLQNNTLTWETAKAFDFGVDFSIYKGRLSGTAEYYNKVTDGLIFAVPLALANGSTTGTAGFRIDQNIGNLYNRGFELSLTGHIIKSKDFNYRTTLNVTTLKNRITKMPPGQDLIQSGSKAYSVGHSIYDFYLRQFYGVDPENGNSLYKTNIITGNSKIIGVDTVTSVLSEANYRYTGESSIPDVYGSMQHNLSYKNFTLGIQLVYSIGGKVYDGNYQSLMHGGTYGTTMHVDAFNRWQNPGDISSVSRFDNGNITNQTGTSDRYLINGSYLQINNITLNYNFGKKPLKAIGAKGASIYVSGDNIALFNKRQGMNNIGSFSGTVSNSYNFNRVFVIGAKVKF